MWLSPSFSQVIVSIDASWFSPENKISSSVISPWGHREVATTSATKQWSVSVVWRACVLRKSTL